MTNRFRVNEGPLVPGDERRATSKEELAHLVGRLSWHLEDLAYYVKNDKMDEAKQKVDRLFDENKLRIKKEDGTTTSKGSN